MERIEPPFGDQRFDNFDQWVSRASSWLTCHADYNNTERGKRGWRGHHFTALCFDSFGRRCRTGSDFQTALEQDAFPVWWIWPDQIVPALLADRADRDALRAQVDAMREAFAHAPANADFAHMSAFATAYDEWWEDHVEPALAKSTGGSDGHQ